MHQPRPYGLFNGQAELSAEDSAAVELLARRITNNKTISGIGNQKRVVTLPSGRTAVATDMGGNFRIIVSDTAELPPQKFSGIADTYMPMLFSGVIKSSIVREDEGEGVLVALTDQCRRRIAGYSEDATLPSKEVELQRFLINYHGKFNYFRPTTPSVFTYTQYARFRPTWHSGAMAAVSQIASGYGRQDMGNLPDDPVERAVMTPPAGWMARIEQQLGNVRLPGYTGRPNFEGKLVADYSWYNSTIVTFDYERDPWLVEISKDGVYAMPLPIIPATRTPAFRQFIESINDSEILEILDRFKGMPSGEIFPESETAFQAWLRAGVIIRVCDTDQFYDGYPFYEACGWSATSTGNELFNTQYEYSSSGLRQANAFHINLNFGSAPNAGMVSGIDMSSVVDINKFNNYMQKLFSALSADGPTELAIKYKLRRATADEILDRSARNIGAEIRYWDGLEMQPIANHSGSMSRSSSGPIFWPHREPTSNGRLKFPNLTGVGCESFNLFSPDYGGDEVKCDTVVFGCYVDDTLEVIKYFYDSRPFDQPSTSTFDDCMVVGSWESVTHSGSSSLYGNFYTSSFDDRVAGSAITTKRKVVGSDLGYGEPEYRTPPLLMRVGGLNRSRYYSHKSDTSTTEGFSAVTAVCVPLFVRDAILHAYEESNSGTTNDEGASKYGMADPTSYMLWTEDTIWHFIGLTQAGCLGEPYPEEGAPVYVDSVVYTPGPCTDFADSGDWFGVGGSFIDVTGVCGPYTSRENQNKPAGGVVIGGSSPGFKGYSRSSSEGGKVTGHADISIGVAGSLRVNDSTPENWYFDASPNISGDFFYKDACVNAMGIAEYASTNEGGVTHWGYSSLADHRTPHYFIGVINE